MLKLVDGIVLKDYQDNAVEFSTSRPASLISLKTGTGKSLIQIKSAIDLINSGKVKKAIIFGTKSSVLELEDEMGNKVEYQDGNSFKPLLITSDDSLRGFFTNPDEDIALIQYEKIHSLDLSLFYKGLSKYPTVVCCDESHKLKNPQALLTKSICALRRVMKYLIFLTATPLTSSLMDLFYQIQILDSSIFKNKTAFKNTFVEERLIKNWKTGRQYPEIVGYKNLETLRERIKDICFDYYPKQDTEFLVHKCTIENTDDYVIASEGLFKTKDAKIHAARLVDLQHVVDRSKEKLKLYLNTIKPILKDGLITYCHYHETVQLLSKVFDRLGIQYRVIHGQISVKERREIKEWFNSNPAKKVLLITSAGSQSLNLQSVNNMVFYNIPFGFGAFSQAKGRIERLFSKHSNFKIHFIITEIDINSKVTGTVDSYKYELISSYGELTSTVLEANEVPKSQLQSFNKKLMDKMKKEMLWKSTGKLKNSFSKFDEIF